MKTECNYCKFWKKEYNPDADGWCKKLKEEIDITRRCRYFERKAMNWRQKMKSKGQMCICCNSHTTLNKDGMCHFCRVKFKGVKGLKPRMKKQLIGGKNGKNI